MIELRVVAHPVRRHILEQLQSGNRSPSQIAADLREPIGSVAYNVSQLEAGGAIELVDARQVRGAIEHFYRARASLCSCCGGSGVQPRERRQSAVLATRRAPAAADAPGTGAPAAPAALRSPGKQVACGAGGDVIPAVPYGRCLRRHDGLGVVIAT